MLFRIFKIYCLIEFYFIESLYTYFEICQVSFRKSSYVLPDCTCASNIDNLVQYKTNSEYESFAVLKCKTKTRLKKKKYFN